MKKYLVQIGLIGVFLLFIPYFFDVLPINHHADISRQLIRVLALADSHFSISLDSYSLFVNPVTQILKNVHGALRPILLFPIFYIIDLFGIRITEISVSAVYVSVGYLLTVINYFFIAKLIGKKKALMFTILISVIPYYVMIIKVSWWMIYYFPFFFAGLWFLHEYLQTQQKRWYAYFCISTSLLILSTPDFFFSGIFYIIYMFVYGFVQSGGVKGAISFFYTSVRSFWTIIPVVTIGFLLAFSYVGFALYGGEYGIMAHLFSKGGIPKYYHPSILLHQGVHAIGLLGLVFFPVMIASLARILGQWDKHKENVLLVTAVFYFFVVMIMFLLAGGITGAMMGLFFFPGGVFMLYALDSLKANWKAKAVLFSILIITTYSQTLLYQKGYEPEGTFLVKTGWFPAPRACYALWCPYHFATYRNYGIKTLGYVARDYLGVSPKEFESREKSQKYREDFLFHSGFGDGPVSHLGRRISDTLEQSNGLPSVIVQFTDGFFVQHPDNIVSIEEHKRINDYLDTNDRYSNVAVITQATVPIMNVYQLDSQKALRTFSVEYYDKAFDIKYATLDQIGKIDLGS